MKNILSLLLITYFFCYAKCNKEDLDFSALPPATQEGRNTLGFMFNGNPWTPKGFNGTANLSLYYDATYSGGVFNLAAYRILNSQTGARQRIVLFGDSIQTPQRIFLPNKNKFAVIFRNDLSGCDYNSTDSTVTIRGGYFDVKKIDRVNNIFSGEFELTLQKNGCENIKITHGRFDMKY
jgi:hypothetical protein